MCEDCGRLWEGCSPQELRYSPHSAERSDHRLWKLQISTNCSQESSRYTNDLFPESKRQRGPLSQGPYLIPCCTRMHKASSPSLRSHFKDGERGRGRGGQPRDCQTYLYKIVKFSESSYLNYQLSWMFENLFHFSSQLTGEKGQCIMFKLVKPKQQNVFSVHLSYEFNLL